VREFNPPTPVKVNTIQKRVRHSFSAWQENPENNLFSSIHAYYALEQLHVSTFWYAPVAGEMTTLHYVKAPQIINNRLNCWNCSRINQIMWN
jgi:hypothetical protein